MILYCFTDRLILMNNLWSGLRTCGFGKVLQKKILFFSFYLENTTSTFGNFGTTAVPKLQNPPFWPVVQWQGTTLPVSKKEQHFLAAWKKVFEEFVMQEIKIVAGRYIWELLRRMRGSQSGYGRLKRDADIHFYRYSYLHQWWFTAT